MLLYRLVPGGLLVGAAIGLFTSGGCVFRDEVITVEPSGAVTIALEIEGSEEEIEAGDAMPSERTGWQVSRSIKKDNDKTKHVLTTKRRFDPGELLPESFADPDDPDADLYLKAPTTLRVERRADGVYYYFRRTYAPRRWAYVRFWQDLAFDDRFKQLGDKPIEELTPQERSEVIGAFVDFEALKQVEFTTRAMEQRHPDLPVEHRLIARQALLEVYASEKEQLNGVIERCVGLSEEAKAECFGAEGERLITNAYDAFVESLRRDAGLTAWQIAGFDRAYERARRYYEITDQLGGHTFEIDVVMPGTIIAHNSLEDDVEVEDDANTSTVSFRFEGDIIRDRPMELIVVSRIGHDQFNRLKGRGYGRD